MSINSTLKKKGLDWICPKILWEVPDRVVTTQELNLGLNKISDEGA